MRTYPSMYRTKKQQLLAAADSIELLILGNSSAMDGIDPSQFKPYSFNLAFAAQPIHYDIQLTKKYLPELPELKYVVISTIFASFYHDGSRSFFYSHYFNINDSNYIFWKENFLQSFFVYKTEQLRHILTHSLHNRPVIELTKGWSSFHNTDYQSVESDTKARLRADFFNGVCSGYEGNDSIYNDLDGFIAFLKEKNIVPILVSMPYHKNLRKYLDKNIENKNTERMTVLSEKYGIMFLNLYADPDFITEDFHNFDHLNEKGAAKLAKKINLQLMIVDK